ncbi:hypothetical protein Q5Y75_24270 [Ruegeria sp. 2205SS24-7]|uniref:hypothetical protein n=1 Tax=Ruegeria discodermiae TaxID=3064389 RepID=UPI002740A0C0|nr:hypothetical protein [Ruegeria sp. 2205SS24-7]MDP5220311.1 hypothetical protein [Ruegeria sp. 2205SS24-7]
MTAQDLMLEAERLEKKIAGESFDGRLRLQPALHAVIRRLAEEGASVPKRLRRLDAHLCDELIESRFDNMPI